MSSLEVKGITRPEILFSDMHKMLYFSFGERGASIANTWQRFNETYWQGQLNPTPIFLPTATPYGHWVGACTHRDKQVINIQLKYGLSDQQLANTLLHEMAHQSLVERGLNAKHNANPWCEEIMRISRDYFDVEFWAAPALPRKVNEKSVRLQKQSDTGQKSISRRDITWWPTSVGINAPVADYYSGS